MEDGVSLLVYWNNESICYSVGAGEDISFDCELINRYNCYVYSFDLTPLAIGYVNNFIKLIDSEKSILTDCIAQPWYTIRKNNVNNFHFYPYGIWSKDGEKPFYAPIYQQSISHTILNLQSTNEYFMAECYKIKSNMNKYWHDHLDLL